MVLIIVHHLITITKNLLILGEGPTYGSTTRKKFSINFTKANTKSCLSLHYDAANSYLFVNEKKIFKFKAGDRIVSFPSQFCLGSVSNGFSNTKSREVFLNGNVYDLSAHYSSIEKPDIFTFINI